MYVDKQKLWGAWRPWWITIETDAGLDSEEKKRHLLVLDFLYEKKKTKEKKEKHKKRHLLVLNFPYEKKKTKEKKKKKRDTCLYLTFHMPQVFVARCSRWSASTVFKIRQFVSIQIF